MYWYVAARMLIRVYCGSSQNCRVVRRKRCVIGSVAARTWRAALASRGFDETRLKVEHCQHVADAILDGLSKQ